MHKFNNLFTFMTLTKTEGLQDTVHSYGYYNLSTILFIDYWKMCVAEPNINSAVSIH